MSRTRESEKWCKQQKEKSLYLREEAMEAEKVERFREKESDGKIKTPPQLSTCCENQEVQQVKKRKWLATLKQTEE